MALGALIRRSAQSGISWPDYLRLWEQFGYGGSQYMVPNGSMAEITAQQAFRNPVVLRCAVIRASVFAEVRFQFQRLSGGRAGHDLYGNPSLQVLERPWTGAGTGDFLTRAEIDNSRYGNSYWKLDPEAAAPGMPFGLVWLDPTRMSIITGDIDGPTGKPYGSKLLAYQVRDSKGQPQETFLPGEILHYAPLPDPEHAFRGISWMSSLMPDITADADLTEFTSSFTRNSATPNLVVQFKDSISQDAFNAFRDRVETGHTGPSAGFKTLYLGAGADVKTVGSNFADMELFATRSYTETRLCVAAGVPASLVGIAEGLKGASLNTGNYSASRRSFADVTMRELWRPMCTAVETLFPAPPGSRVWYDDRNVAFLQADMQDAATQRQADAATIASLVNAGYEPDSVVTAVTGDDWTALVHSGLYSVQLQVPGELGEPGGPTTLPADPVPAAAA